MSRRRVCSACAAPMERAAAMVPVGHCAHTTAAVCTSCLAAARAPDLDLVRVTLAQRVAHELGVSADAFRSAWQSTGSWDGVGRRLGRSQRAIDAAIDRVADAGSTRGRA